MDNPRDPGLLSKYGAAVTILAVALGGASWVFGLAGRVDSHDVQITALQATVAQRSQVVTLIDNIEKDIARLETRQEQIRADLAEFRSQREDYREIIGRQDEHLEAVDDRLGRVQDQVVELERKLRNGDYGREGQLGHSR